MSKENNLKDYLTDLYEGIVSKKPGASRNPQHFRREIEAIQGGGVDAILKTIGITANGTYNASDEGANGFSKITVNVQNPDCSGEHIIEVDELPEIAEVGAVYKVSSVIKDVVFHTSAEVIDSPWMKLKEVGSFLSFPVHFYTIPTRTIDNIHASTEFSANIYLIEDENEMSVYVDKEWVSLNEILGERDFSSTSFGGFISDVSEATDPRCYYAIVGEGYFQYTGKTFDGLYMHWDESINLTPIVVLLILYLGINIEYHYANTKPTDPYISDTTNSVYHLYYIEDERGISYYDGTDWQRGGDVIPISYDMLTQPDEIYEDGVYAVIGDSWKELYTSRGMSVLLLPGTCDVRGKSLIYNPRLTGRVTANQNGMYDVVDCEYLFVDIPFIKDVTQLPNSSINFRTAYRIGSDLYICQRDYRGEWRLNDIIAYESYQNFDSTPIYFNFTCAGVEYKGVTAEKDIDWSEYHLYYILNNDERVEVYNGRLNTWELSHYQTITITSADVDEWVENNATKTTDVDLGTWIKYVQGTD